MSTFADRSVLKPVRLRFGMFEMDERRGELRREGAVVHLPRQPFKVLWLLASRAGDVVTRDEIRRELWGDDTYVDFDGGLNFCIAQVRKALRDSPESPRFIHTLPRRGYRFIAPVEVEPEWPVAVRAPDPTPTDAAPAPADPEPADVTTAPMPREEIEAERARTEPAPALEPPRPRRAMRVALGVAAVLAMAGAAMAAMAMWRAGRASSRPALSRLTFRRGVITGARFAPQGRILYSAAWDGAPSELFEIPRIGAEARALGVRGAALRSPLPAGDILTILYEPAGIGNSLAVVPPGDGAPHALADDVVDADGADEHRVALVRRVGNQTRLEFPAGHEVYHTASGITSMRVSPDGERLAFLEHPDTGDDRGSVVTVDRAGTRTVLCADWASLEGLAWRPDGTEVWFTGTPVGADLALYAVAPGSAPRQLYATPGRLVLHDVAADGRVLLARVVREMKIIASVDGQERELQWADASMATGLAADGSAITFSESGEAGGAGYTIYYRKIDGSPAVRLGQGAGGTISPDSRWVVSMPLTGPDHLMVLPTGPGSPRRLGGRLESVRWTEWLPDSRAVVFLGAEAGHGLRLWTQPLEGGDPRPVSPEGMADRRLIVSPDGRRAIARPLGDGPWMTYPIDGVDLQPVPGMKMWDRPLAWANDGESVFVATGQGPEVEIWRVSMLDGQRQLLRRLGHAGQLARIALPFITGDARTLVYTTDTTLADLFVVSGLR